jgi:perosamine synthetase
MPGFWGNEQKYMLEALASTWITHGPFVDRFESEIAGRMAVSHALSASNGTTALHMVYLALGIRPGDEIIIPGFAFMAAANIALQMQAVPVFAEVDPGTWCLNAGEILSLAGEKKIAVIEDAAEAFLSRYKGKMAGTLGTAGCYSFQSTKTVTTGEGGMVVTSDEALYEAMSLYRNHGMLRKRHYWHELPGNNFRLTNIQAALGCAQMENLDRITAERLRVHERYRANLSETDGLVLQEFPAEVDPVLWSMAVKLDSGAYGDRDNILAGMSEFGIETRPGFYAAGLMRIYNFPRLPVCEEISRRVISLPTYPLLSNDQIDYVCEKLIGLKK